LDKISTSATTIFIFQGGFWHSTLSNEKLVATAQLLDLFMEEHVSWVPTYEPFYAEGSTPIWILEARPSKAFKDLQQNQYPIDCVDRQYLVTEQHTAGFGSWVYVNMWAMEAAPQVVIYFVF
jgi:hypothetical protein